MAAAISLIAALQAPGSLTRLDGRGWTTLMALARDHNLLGALAAACSAAAVDVPVVVARHLEGAAQLALRQRQSVIWEAHQLQRALGGLGVPILLLKGAAYVMSDLGLGRGRTFGDIDILVPRASLGDVESRLMLSGWVSSKTDAYDQRYYRQWMHELPPMMHMRRGTVIDVHHTILPLTARHSPDPGRLLARATALASLPSMYVPAPEDLLAHSLTHLMHEGELHNGLRDLHDVDEMARRFGADGGFWDRFSAAVQGNDLAWPVGLGLHLARAVFGTPVPPGLVAQMLGGPPPMWLEAVYLRGLGMEPSLRGFAEWLVYVRAHALRMPLPLLLRHLAIKGWRRVLPDQGQEDAAAANRPGE